MIKNILKSNF